MGVYEKVAQPSNIRIAPLLYSNYLFVADLLHFR